MDFFEERDVSGTSLTVLQDLIKECFKKRAEYDVQKKVLTAIGEQVDALEQQILSILETHNQPSFAVEGVGSVYKTTKYSVSMPKDTENAERLRVFLYDKGLQNELTVNHNALNKLYKDLKFEAESQGLKTLDVLPGVGEPTPYTTIGMRKGK